MTNDETALLKLLKAARHEEEKGIPIYTKHLGSALFWTGIPQDKVQRAKDILSQLSDESKVHKIEVERLIARLERR